MDNFDRESEELRLLRELEAEVKKLTSEIGKLNGLEKDIKRIEETIVSISTKIETLKKDVFIDIKEEHKRVDENFVNNDKFEPIKIIVYGAVGLILIAFFGVLTTLVIKAPMLAAIPAIIP